MRLRSCKFLLTALHCRHETSPFVVVVRWVFWSTSLYHSPRRDVSIYLCIFSNLLIYSFTTSSSIPQTLWPEMLHQIPYHFHRTPYNSDILHLPVLPICDRAAVWLCCRCYRGHHPLFRRGRLDAIQHFSMICNTSQVYAHKESVFAD